jgi:hypothetical protein
MDTVLLAVTVLSLAMAGAMSFIVLKLVREERARSDARVSALAALASQGAVAEMPTLARSEPAEAQRPVAAARPGRLDDFEIRPASQTVTGVPHLFEEQAAPSPWGRRFAVIGGLAAIALAVAFTLKSTAVRQDAAVPEHPAVAGAPAVRGSGPERNRTEGKAPLELVSLRHAQEAQRLVITGLVQNPRSGGPISHVVATAFLFGADGAFLTSSRAPLDFTTLAPGDESPFVVTVPVNGQVARYRIGFRTDDGRVIEHVDRRAPDALAQK